MHDWWLMMEWWMMGGDDDWDPGARCSCCPLPTCVFSHHLITSMVRLVDQHHMNFWSFHFEQRTIYLKNLAQRKTLSLWYLQGLYNVICQTSLDFVLDLDHSLGPSRFVSWLFPPLQAVHTGFMEDWASWIASNSRRTVETQTTKDWQTDLIFSTSSDDTTGWKGTSQQISVTYLNRSHYRNTQCNFFLANFSSIPSTSSLSSRCPPGLFGCRICCLGSRIGCLFDSRPLAFLGCQQGRENMRLMWRWEVCEVVCGSSWPPNQTWHLLYDFRAWDSHLNLHFWHPARITLQKWLTWRATSRKCVLLGKEWWTAYFVISDNSSN